MAEEHAMEVRWSGDAVLGNLMAEAARQRGFPTDVAVSYTHLTLPTNVQV